MASKKKNRRSDKPPYFNNPHKELEQTRKHMETKFSEPTKDTFSPINSTEDFGQDTGEYFDTQKSARPTIEGRFNLGEWVKKNWGNALIVPFCLFVAWFVWDSNSRMSVIENTNDSQENSFNEIKEDIREINRNIREISGNQKINNFRIDQNEREIEAIRNQNRYNPGIRNRSN